MTTPTFEMFSEIFDTLSDESKAIVIAEMKRLTALQQEELDECLPNKGR